MAFGLISTIALLSLGIPPAQASAAVHTAEVATTGASGLSHLFHQNVDRRLLLTLGAPGVLGGVLGAYVLSNIDGRAILPFVSAYLLVMGLFILMKAAKLAPTNEDAKSRICRSARSCRRLLGCDRGWRLGTDGHFDAYWIRSCPAKSYRFSQCGGILHHSGGSVHILHELATAHLAHIAALIIGGLLAAPFGGYIVRHLQPRALMAAVGVLVSALALFQLAKSFG